MVLTIYNTTSGTLTYLSGTISVTSGGNTTISSQTQQFQLCLDGKFRSDILANNIYLSDGTNNFGNNDAINYLFQLIQAIGPVSDAVGNPIGSLSNTLNVNTKNPRTYSTPATASVGTTPTLILAANSARIGLYLSNTSTQQISFGFNGNVPAYQYGITLYPGEKFWMDEYSFSTGAIYAITTGAATYIGVQEIT